MKGEIAKGLEFFAGLNKQKQMGLMPPGLKVLSRGRQRPQVISAVHEAKSL